MDILAIPYHNALEVKCANVLSQRNLPPRIPHYNPNYELLAVSEGPLYLQIENERLTLHTGDVVLLHPWQPHAFWNQSEANGEFYWVQFQPTSPLHPFTSDEVNWEQYHRTARTNLLQLDQPRTPNTMLLPVRMHIPNKFTLFTLFEQLLDELREPQGNFLFRTALCLGSILEHISTSLLQSKSAENRPSKDHDIFCKTTLFLHNNFMNDIGKEVLEKHLQRSYEYIGQVFKKYSAVTIGEYVQILRIQRAKFLLRHTSKTISEISEEVGIPDTFYFSKIFKKITGMQPSKYRHEPIK
jgi:AraC-like DNA-binding protein